MNKTTLVNGVEIPMIGMGTYPLNGELLLKTMEAAYQLGYRLFDTSDNYYNEEDLGNSLNYLYKHTSANRSDFFLVSKLSDELYEPNSLGGGTNRGIYFWKTSPVMQKVGAVHEVVEKKIAHTLRSLQTDYLDLLLMHWPYPDFFEEIWFEMERLYKEGKVRAIGVCNCRERHFEKLKRNCVIFPMVNQFESSPINTKTNLVNYCHDNNIRIMTYSPLMNLKQKSSPGYKVYLKELADKYHKGIAQIVLRFDIQRGLIPIPKSTHKERLEDNFNVFDFELQADEIERLLNFNENRQSLPESKSCPGL